MTLNQIDWWSCYTAKHFINVIQWWVQITKKALSHASACPDAKTFSVLSEHEMMYDKGTNGAVMALSGTTYCKNTSQTWIRKYISCKLLW